jgi:hypothetical protein
MAGADTLIAARLTDTSIEVRLPLGFSGDSIRIAVDDRGESVDVGSVELVGFRGTRTHQPVVGGDRRAWRQARPFLVLGHVGTQLGTLDLASGAVTTYPDSVYQAGNLYAPNTSVDPFVVLDLRTDSLIGWQLGNQLVAIYRMARPSVFMTLPRYVLDLGDDRFFVGGKHFSQLVSSSDGGATWSDTTLWWEEPTYPVVSADGKWLTWSYVTNAPGLPIVETPTGQLRYIAEATRPQAVDFSPDGMHVFAAGATATLSSALVVADVATTVVDTILPLSDRALAIQADPTTSRLLLVTQGGSGVIHLRIFDRSTLALLGDLPVPVDASLCSGQPCWGGVVSADPRGLAYFTPGWGAAILEFDVLP